MDDKLLLNDRILPLLPSLLRLAILIIIWTSILATVIILQLSFETRKPQMLEM